MGIKSEKKLTDRISMKYPCAKLLLMFLSLVLSMAASAQTVTRPGGGGERDWHEPSKESIFADFKEVFGKRIQKCDPKAKNLHAFPEIYQYLYLKHVGHLVGTHKDLKNQKSPSCQGNEGEVLHCLLSKEVKQEIVKLISDKDFKTYLIKGIKLSKEEAEARIMFLRHLSGNLKSE